MPLGRSDEHSITPEDVRAAMRRCGKTLVDIAEEVGGIHPSQLSRFYRNERPLTRLNYDRLCAYLKLTPTAPTERALETDNGSSEATVVPDAKIESFWRELAVDSSLWNRFREQLGREDQVIFANFILGKSNVETANSLGIAPQEVDSTLSRLRRYLIAVLRGI